MKIVFDDNSFVQIEESTRPDKLLTITMCGINPDTKKLIMSASNLDKEQTKKILEYLQSFVEK